MKKDVEETKAQHKDTMEFLNELSAYLDDNFLIEGRKAVEWKAYFTIFIPEEITFATLIELAKEVAFKYQRAAYYREKQVIQMTILEQSKFDKYHETYNEVRVETQQKTGKPLAAESCKIAATLATKNLESAISTQKVIKDFWVKTCDTLTEVRKLIELMGYSLSGDARAQKDFIVKGKMD